MYPMKPTLFTDFFASRNAGFALRCDDLQINDALKVGCLLWHCTPRLCIPYFVHARRLSSLQNTCAAGQRWHGMRTCSQNRHARMARADALPGLLHARDAVHVIVLTTCVHMRLIRHARTRTPRWSPTRPAQTLPPTRCSPSSW